jgi:single-stranded DNA-binding protein
MIFIRPNAEIKIFAKVWNVEAKEKYTDLRISTSEKVEKDGNTSYINSNWFARAVGKAHNQAKNLSQGDSVVITKAKLSNEPYEKDGQKRSAFKFVVLEFESKDNAETSENDNAGDSEENLPW